MLNTQLRQKKGAITNFSEKKITIESKIRKEFFKKNTQLSSYFNTIYQALNFVEASEIINDNNKKFYIGILAAQLSTEEKDMMFHYTSTEIIVFHEFRSLLMCYLTYFIGNLTLDDIKNM